MLTKFIVISFHSLWKPNHYAVHLKLIQLHFNKTRKGKIKGIVEILMKTERLRKVPKILEAINNDELRNDGRNDNDK